MVFIGSYLIKSIRKLPGWLKPKRSSQEGCLQHNSQNQRKTKQLLSGSRVEPKMDCLFKALRMFKIQIVGKGKLNDLAWPEVGEKGSGAIYLKGKWFMRCWYHKK